MKKVIILAPHQDDELILCGSFLKELTEKSEVYIVYTTNGNYEASVHTIRMEEALKVCALYGVKKNNVIFLGYANEYDINGPHIYNASECEVVKSQYGIDMTYGLENHPEYCFMKQGIHHSYTRNNMKQDLFDVVSEIMPDVIFATDMEIHPDHKCNSLMLDEVLGDILKLHQGYAPIVLKKPGYMTSWFSKADYTEQNNVSTTMNYNVVRTNGHRSAFDNPYIKWSDRIRIPVGESTRDKSLEDNILYKALQLYKSQNVVSHFEMMQNSDVVFWQRRTDSLTYRAKVVVSSGNASYLNDFKIVDSSDVKRKAQESWNVDASVWRPELKDKEKKIDFYLENIAIISEIDIYQEYYPKSRVINAHLVINDNEISIGALNCNGITKVQFEPVETDRVSFVIDEISDETTAPGITEIEIFKFKGPVLVFAKLMIRNNFVYDYYVRDEELIRLQVYEYWSDGSTKVGSLDDYDIVAKQGEENLNIENGKVMDEIYSTCSVYIKNHRNTDVEDTITLIPSSEEKKDLGRVKDKITSCVTDLINDEVGIYRGKCADKLASLSYGEMRNDMGWFVKEFVRGYICEDYKRKNRRVKKVFFLGTPDHMNIGDHAITVATYKFMKDIMGNVEIEEIPIMNFARKLPYLINNIREDDLIVLQGGGNMGNVYWRNERIRREVITRFPNNIKIVFPETIYYEDNEEARKDFRISKKVYQNEKTFIFARERKSYEIIKKAYPLCNISIVPDIVCYMNCYKDECIRKDVGLCFRNDLERGINESIEKSIEDILADKGEEYKKFDMMSKSRGYIGKANRNRIVEQKIAQIASFKYVITDRLHGMILSYITGTPCIVYSKYNHKIESFYETWFKNVDYIQFIKSEDDFEDAIDCVRILNECKPKKMNYDKLVELMEEWI